jgi:hypothetical protein
MVPLTKEELEHKGLLNVRVNYEDVAPEQSSSAVPKELLNFGQKMTFIPSATTATSKVPKFGEKMTFICQKLDMDEKTPPIEVFRHAEKKNIASFEGLSGMLAKATHLYRILSSK